MRRPGRKRACAIGLAAPCVLLGLVVSSGIALRAGGPRAVSGAGQPMTWSTAGPIVYHPDSGPLGQLDNATARALLAEAFAAWAATGSVSFSEGPSLTGDVDAAGVPATNPNHYLHHWRREGDGLAPVIFDADGSIIDHLFGMGARHDILGVSGLDTALGHCAGGAYHGQACRRGSDCPAGTCAATAQIAEASIVINGAFFDGLGPAQGSPEDLPSLAALRAVLVHEIGHFVNLDHSVLNSELAHDGDPSNDVYLPTMYPVQVEDEAALASLNPDDIVALRNLYDSGATTGLGGGVTDAGGAPLQGAQVVLRKTDDPLMTAYSTISGGRYFPCNPGSTCDPCNTACDPGAPAARGAYAVDFIAAGDYTACVEQIDTRFSIANDSFVGPLATPPVLFGPEECHDASEGTSEDPDDAATLVAGTLVSIDITLNPLPAADPFEPNDTLAGASSLADLGSGMDTAGAMLGTGDVDFYAVPVSRGARVRVDIDASELGSGLDALLALHDTTGARTATSDDTVDPDSGSFSFDPAIEVVADAAGTARVVVSSFGDADLDGSGGLTSGPYWIRVEVEADTDGDGIADGADNCPAGANAGQQDFDGDGDGNLCDLDDDDDGLPDTTETNTGVFVNPSNTGSNPLNPDTDGDGVGDGIEVTAGRNPNATSQGASLFGPQRVLSTAANGAASVFAADVDADGDLDAISASEFDDKIAWYENTDGAGTFGTPRIISTTAAGAYSVFAADVDGDRDTDVIAASWLDDTVGWYPNVNGAGTFGARQVISTAGFGPFSVFGADVDGDGDTDVVSASYFDDTIAWHENLDGAGSFGARQVISTAASAAASVFATDVDGDGDVDVLSASELDNKIAWYENTDGAGTFSSQQVISTAAAGAFSVFAADVDGDGDVDALSASDADDKIAWYENLDGTGSFGTQRVISTAAEVARDVFAADVDGDGDADVVSASDTDNKIAWYENTDGAGGFGPQRVISTNTVGAFSAFAADVDGDGDADVLSASGFDRKIAWYENLTIHSSATFPEQRVISTAADVAISVHAADLDGDGDPDALSASQGNGLIAWYENTDGAGAFGSQQIITTAAANAFSVSAADLDRDGDADVLSASPSDDKIAWYENLDGAGSFGTQQIISTAADGAGCVAVADVDGDGDMDVLSASELDDKIAWYENLDGAGSFGTQHVVSTAADGARSVFPVDVDGDGDIDVVSASGNDDEIAWYENTDGAGSFGSQQVISTAADSATAVFASDVDGDGDLDVLSGSPGDGKIAWYENRLDEVSADFGLQQVLSTLTGASFVLAADLDDDGDSDVLSASGTADTIAWCENRLDEAGADFGPLQTISTAADQPRGQAVFAADVDSDGRLDVLSASQDDDKIAWYPNRGGPFAFLTQGTAPSNLDSGASATVLRITVAHRGRSDDSSIALSELGLLFEEGPGDPLTQGEGTALIQQVEVYLDSGSGGLEAGAGRLLSSRTFSDFFLNGFVFAPADPRILVAPGESKDFLVVVRTTAGASQQVPDRFRVVHVVDGGSMAADAAALRPLRPENPQDVASSIVVATGPDSVSPRISAVYPPDGTVDVALSSHVVLLVSEPVDPDTATAEAVSVAVGGGKVPGALLVSADRRTLTFDPQGNLDVDTDYSIEVNGLLRDLAGNATVPFTSTFDTTADPASGTLQVSQIGDPTAASASGSIIPGTNADDNSGSANAAAGDVNVDGISDLLIGAPNADAGGTTDAGKATLIFGHPELQSNSASLDALVYLDTGGSETDGVGQTLSRAGDVGSSAGIADGVEDFLIGAPLSNANGTDSGKVYLIFGHPDLDEQAPGPLDLSNLPACATPTLCGVVFRGAAAFDQAGSSVSHAGDPSNDGIDDLLIGAPGADPNGTESGKVYLVFGPLGPGTVTLSGVGSIAHGATTAGLVFHGEAAAHRAGASVSWWEDAGGDGIDDLLIGAPEATTYDEFGTPLSMAGIVYAIHGGLANLDDAASPGVIELSRVANGQADEVAGTVFLGDRVGGTIGRSITGAVDVDGDGEDDVIFGADNEAWVIPGDGPKSATGTSQTGGPKRLSDTLRTSGSNVVSDFGAFRYVPGDDGDLGNLRVGPAGDINNDGVDDFAVGAPLADPAGRTDAGRVYFVYGGNAPTTRDVELSEIGRTEPGLVLEGFESGDALGSSVGGGTDLNADGIDDGLAGAPFADSLPGTPQDAGESYVISPVAADAVMLLTLSKAPGTVVLEWTVTHRALAYNVYRGELGRVRTAGGVRTATMCAQPGACQLACGIDTDSDSDGLPDTTDPAPPPPDDGWVYLITGENRLGEGPLQASSAVPPIHDGQCP